MLMNESEARYNRFINSPVAVAHKQIRDEVVSELHLEFEPRNNGLHAVCVMCRGSVAQLTDKKHGVEKGYVYTLDSLESLFMAHFMQRHYDQEGRTA